MLELICNTLLIKNKIKIEEIFNILEIILFKKFDFGDIFFQNKEIEVFILDKKIIKQGYFFKDSGFGIRVIHQNMTGFSYSTEINLKNLFKILEISCLIIPQKFYKNFLYVKNKKNFFPCSNFENPLKNLDIKKKIEFLYCLDKKIRKIDARVVDVTIILTSEYENILIASTDVFKLLGDIRILVNLSITVIVEENGKREKGNCGGGKRSDINYFFEKNLNGEIRSEFWAREAVRIALLALHAKISPSGTFPVVLGSGWPGILLHEAVGHGLESDFIRKKTSIFTKKKGEKIASSLCTVIDDGTLKNKRGSFNIDDEGTCSQRTVLIQNGILLNFLYDKYNAFLMNKISTGNGRRESYAFLPLPRMTNTFLSAGDSNIKEMIESIDYGIYAVNFSGGQVDITSGNFVFEASEAYIIQKGKVGYALKGAMFSGSGSHTMNLISMIGNDLELDNGVGTCSKEGQSVPVGVGQPTIKIDKLIIGGV